jgi:hypothetical protein
MNGQNPKGGLQRAVDAFNGFVKSFNTWLTNNPPTSWGIKRPPQLIEQVAPAPNSTLIEIWDQTFEDFKTQRQDAFRQIYWLALIGMMWDASGGFGSAGPFSKESALELRQELISMIRECRALGDGATALRIAQVLRRLEILIDKNWPGTI